jgi:hypothetical protein
VPSATGVTEKYFGGAVIPNAKVYVVWWGNPANLNSSLTAAHGGIADFFTGITNSAYLDWFNEYNTTITVQAGSHAGTAGTNQRIGRGNYAGTVTLSNIPSGNSITDAQVQSALNGAFTAGALPSPDDDSIYAVFFPPGLTITASDGSQSCSAFGAYHDAAIRSPAHDAYYLIVPDCGSSFSGFTNVTSHELAEAITDTHPTPGSNPDYPQAWNDSSGSEVGDLCESSSGTVATAVGSFTVQGIWDERSQGCKVTTTAAQDFNVAVSPNSASLASGGTGTYTVQTATTAGAAETLALAVSAPAGLTASVSPASVQSGQTATLTVSGTASGSAQVIVTATGTGGAHTAALLVAGGAVTTNDFALTITPPTSQTVVSGASPVTVTYPITTSVTAGSAQSVSLAIAGLASGITGAFNPASVTAGGSSTLTLTVPANAPASTSSFTVTGTGASATHTATGTLTVTSNVTVTGLTNGDFEIGTLAGWTTTGTASNIASGCHGGTHCAQLGSTSPTNGDSSVSQTFTAPTGATTLAFFYRVTCPDTVTYDWAAATLKDNTAGTTATLLAHVCTAAGAWTQVTGAVSAGHSYTLTLTSHDDNYAGDPTYTLYDDVTLAAAPPPPPPPPSGLTDGDFEGGVTGWTTAGTTSVASSGCHGGTKCAEAGSTSATNGDSSFAQTFTAGTGSSKLSLWYKVTCPDTVTYDWATATLKDNTSGTTVTILPKTCTTAGAWTQITSAVTAGHSYTLTLTSHDDDYAGDPTYTLFDDVVLQ